MQKTNELGDICYSAPLKSGPQNKIVRKQTPSLKATEQTTPVNDEIKGQNAQSMLLYAKQSKEYIRWLRKTKKHEQEAMTLEIENYIQDHYQLKSLYESKLTQDKTVEDVEKLFDECEKKYLTFMGNKDCQKILSMLSTNEKKQTKTLYGGLHLLLLEGLKNFILNHYFEITKNEKLIEKILQHILTLRDSINPDQAFTPQYRIYYYEETLSLPRMIFFITQHLEYIQQPGLALLFGEFSSYSPTQKSKVIHEICEDQARLFEEILEFKEFNPEQKNRVIYQILTDNLSLLFINTKEPRVSLRMLNLLSKKSIDWNPKQLENIIHQTLQIRKEFAKDFSIQELMEILLPYCQQIVKQNEDVTMVKIAQTITSTEQPHEQQDILDWYYQIFSRKNISTNASSYQQIILLYLEYIGTQSADCTEDLCGHFARNAKKIHDLTKEKSITHQTSTLIYQQFFYLLATLNHSSLDTLSIAGKILFSYKQLGLDLALLKPSLLDILIKARESLGTPTEYIADIEQTLYPHLSEEEIQKLALKIFFLYPVSLKTPTPHFKECIDKYLPELQAHPRILYRFFRTYSKMSKFASYINHPSLSQELEEYTSFQALLDEKMQRGLPVEFKGLKMIYEKFLEKMRHQSIKENWTIAETKREIHTIHHVLENFADLYRHSKAKSVLKWSSYKLTLSELLTEWPVDSKAMGDFFESCKQINQQKEKEYLKLKTLTTEPTKDLINRLFIDNPDKNTTDAIVLIADLYRVDPKSPDSYILKIKSLTTLGRFEEAMSLLDEARNLFQQQPIRFFLLEALIYKKQHLYFDELDTYRCMPPFFGKLSTQMMNAKQRSQKKEIRCLININTEWSLQQALELTTPLIQEIYTQAPSPERHIKTLECMTMHMDILIKQKNDHEAIKIYHQIKKFAQEQQLSIPEDAIYSYTTLYANKAPLDKKAHFLFQLIQSSQNPQEKWIKKWLEYCKKINSSEKNYQKLIDMKEISPFLKHKIQIDLDIQQKNYKKALKTLHLIREEFGESLETVKQVIACYFGLETYDIAIFFINESQFKTHPEVLIALAIAYEKHGLSEKSRAIYLDLSCKYTTGLYAEKIREKIKQIQSVGLILDIEMFDMFPERDDPYQEDTIRLWDQQFGDTIEKEIEAAYQAPTLPFAGLDVIDPNFTRPTQQQKGLIQASIFKNDTIKESHHRETQNISPYPSTTGHY